MLLCIIMEALEWRLAEQWIEQGHLPNMKALKERGYWTLLETPAEISSGTVWSSMNTGTSPSKHGLAFFHRQLKNGTYDICKKYADDALRDPFWDRLSEVGKRVGVFDVPVCRPPAELNGVMLVRWGDEHPSWKKDSRPPELYAEVESKFGIHPLTDWYQDRFTQPQDWETFIKHLEDATERRTRIAQYMMSKGPLDLFIVNYAEPHWAGHMAWHIQDPEHAEYDPGLAKVCPDPVLRVYKAADQAVAHLLEDFEGDVLLVSNTGMGPTYNCDSAVEEILERAGFMHSGSQGTLSVSKVEKVVPGALIGRIKSVFPERLWDSVTRKVLNVGKGWKNCKAFPIPGDHSTLIRLNLEGREPAGKVKAGDYDAVCDELRQVFEELRVADSEVPAVIEVVKVRQRYPGENSDEMPDLVIRWKDDEPIAALKSERLGRIANDQVPKRTGSHRKTGFMVAAGPSFRQGARPEAADLLDFAPTVMHLMGQPIPDDFDGNVLSDCLA